ncbi:1661_t:CDS:2 [Dentiscutata heterogama]|uniref:1661_t:CDS:1 n=1 Tax=Dentiscutata heterogama TaxID=1316150 RepID=A0ACA9K6E4_9GLOM|nr:1661_t:CDS:2 [Dentiscutata heterogama]
MGNCGSSDSTNRRINKTIKEDEKRMKTEVKLLLLGAGESGKSTILKQMRLIHASGFNSTERETYRSIVFLNIMDSMSLVLEAMEYYKIPFSNSSNMVDQPFPVNYLEPLKSLWSDNGVLKCYMMDRVFSQSYVPTNQDIIRCRMKTTGIVETVFYLGPLTYRMFDVGGQRSERKKWIHCFEDVTANQMQEALMLFDSICNSQWFVNTSMILFLNKIDIFKEKIKISPINKYFPDYTGPSDDFKSTSHYFKRRFQRLNRSDSKEIYPHFTNATDTNLLRHIMGSVTGN